MERALAVSRERVQHLHARPLEIACVASRESKIVLKRRGCDHAVQQGQRVSLPLQINHQFGPASANRSVPRQAIYRLHYLSKPLFELSQLTFPRKRKNADAQFAQNDRVYNKIPFVGSQPINGFAIGAGFVGSLSTFASTR